MIDLTSLRAPGWGRVVAELSAPAPDDRAYLERLMAVMAQVSAARQAVLMAPDRREGDEAEVRVVAVWPPDATADAPGGPPPAPRIEHEDQVRKAGRSALSSAQARAFGLDEQGDQYYAGTGGRGYLLAVPLGAAPGTGTPTGVVTLLIEPRSRDAVRSTLAMAEVLAGYVAAHGARQALRRAQQASAALDLATRLIAAVNTAPGFKGAMLQLVNDLAKHFALDRVAIGWARPRDRETIRVTAISDTEHFDQRMAMVQKLKAAMEECLDQGHPVVYPPPPAEGSGGDAVLAQAIVHAHRELAASDATLRIASLPLRIDEDVVGVVTLETTAAGAEGAISLPTVELVQSALDLVAPMLRTRRSDDRNLALRAWDSLMRLGSVLVGPRHTAWKLAALLALAGIVFVSTYQTTYRVGAEAVIEPAVRRVVSAPIEGAIARIKEGLEPGTEVREGEVLVQLDDQEWVLRRADAQSRYEQAVLQASEARRENDAGKAEQYMAQARRSEAEMRLYDHQIERAQIKAPIAGKVLSGKLEDRIGATVRVGDPLLEIAPLDTMVVLARVDERDIGLVAAAHERGRGTGRLATRSRPTEAFEFRVERIVPLAEAREGTNTFEVRATLLETAPWMQPGMEGRAKFDTERHSLLWIGTRRIADAVRLWLW